MLFEKDSEKGLFGGVLAGVAKLIGIDALYVRIAFVVLGLFTNFGVAVVLYALAYLVASI